jgi:hypothetical protein
MRIAEEYHECNFSRRRLARPRSGMKTRARLMCVVVLPARAPNMEAA